MSVSVHPFYDSEPAQLIRERLDALRQRKSATQLANEVGYKKENILLAFADGDTRVTIDRALSLAKALESDPAEFFRAVLESYGIALEGIKIVNDPACAANRPTVDLNFKVDPDFHRSFKTKATTRGMSMKELLEASFRAFLESNVRQS